MVVRWLRRAPAILVAVAMLVLLARTTDTPALPDHEVPEGFEPAPPPTTEPPGAQLPLLASVRGTTTTTVPANTGRARVYGTVTGPDGPVSGAVVRLERVVGDVTQVVEVGTTPVGFYDAAMIGGGRYRVRAYLPPTLAQATGEVVYLRHDEERSLDLVVDEYVDPIVAVATAPEQPLLDDPVNIAVRVTGRFVDPEGVVRTQSVPGANVQVSTTGGWSQPSPSSTTTDGGGQARFASQCRTTGPSQLFVTVRLPAALPTDLPTSASFDLRSCVDPATLTTTTTTSTTLPGGSSTSTSTSTSSTTSTTR